MASRTETTWTCDRCRGLTIIPGTSPPADHVRFYKSGLTGSTRDVLGDLCPPCASLVIATAIGADSVEEADREPVPT